MHTVSCEKNDSYLKKKKSFKKKKKKKKKLNKETNDQNSVQLVKHKEVSDPQEAQG